MLQRAWYLPDDDFYRHTADIPSPIQLPGQLHLLLGYGRLPHSPARTLHALRIAAIALGHVHDATEHAPTALPQPADTQLVLLGLNLVTAHLAQLLPHLAGHIDHDTGPFTHAIARSMLCTAADLATQIAGQLATAHHMLQSASGHTAQQPDEGGPA